MKKIIEKLNTIKEKINKTKNPTIIYIIIIMIIISILPYILPILIIITPLITILLILYIIYPKNNNIVNTNNDIKNKKQSDYNINNSPMTKKELHFHKNLKLITDKYNLIIIPQLQLQRIFKIVDKNNITAFNKIKAKSIDFAIVDKNYNYKLFIELDDCTHKYQNRIERDNFVNQLFENNGLKLLRIKTKSYYDINELELKIKENI